MTCEPQQQHTARRQPVLPVPDPASVCGGDARSAKHGQLKWLHKNGLIKGKAERRTLLGSPQKKGVLALVTFGTTSRIYCLDARHLIWSWWILAWELDETFLPSMPPCLVSRSTRSKWLLLAARNSSVSSCCRSHGASRIMSNKKLHEKAAVVHGQWMTCRRPQNDIQTQTSLS